MTSMLYTISMQSHLTEPEPAQPRNKAKARLSPLTYACGIFFGVTYVAARVVLRNHEVAGLAKAGLCFLFAIAFAYFFWRSERDLLASNDELEQKIRTQAMALAFPLALAMVMLLGAFESAGISPLKPVDYWLPVFWSYFIALFCSKRRYQ